MKNLKDQNLLKSIFFQFILFCTLIASPLAKTQEETGDEEADNVIESTKGDILVVTAAGLGGAILGLSTLSFVEEPKKHTRNIIVGAAIGIMIGVGIVGYMQATKSRDMFFEDEEGYEEGAPPPGGAGEGAVEEEYEEEASLKPLQFDRLSPRLSMTQRKVAWLDLETSENSYHDVSEREFLTPLMVNFNFTF